MRNELSKVNIYEKVKSGPEMCKQSNLRPFFLREELKGIPECGAAGVMVVLPRGRLSHYSESASATTLSLHIHIQFASRPYLFDISERLLPQLPACSS